ncbi:MAG TPA: hypothetical protein GX530_05520 [Corynebacteriales bacterium]|nr:hypothetical protein [Mycobacteriales bacterium]
MLTSVFPKKMFALAAAAALVLSASTFAAPSAEASVSNNTINSSCRTNGAPMKYNVTRPKTDSISIDAPDSVKAGENVVVKFTLTPEIIPGKESIATMKELRDVAFRFTIDSPENFVTARLVGGGSGIAGGPKISLVGGNLLVFSGATVPVNGVDHNWALPTIEMTYKAPTNASSMPTFHPAVEGPAGEFNNPANYFTAKTVTDSILGELVIQLNCQSQAGAQTLRTIKVEGADKAAAKDKDKDKKKDKDAKDKKKDKDAKDKDAKATPTTDDNGLEVVDEDESVETEMPENSLPGGMIAGIVIVVLAAAGGIGYGVYRGVKKKKGN